MGKKSEKFEEKVKEFILQKCSRGELVTEEQIAKKFGLSRTPVREITRDFLNRGIILSKRKKGMSFKLPSKKEIEDVYDLRIILESFAIKLALRNIKNTDLKKLEELSEKYEKARENKKGEKAEYYDRKFHEHITNLSKNKFLIKIIKDLRILNTSFYLRNLVFPFIYDFNPYTHKKIIEGIKTGNSKKAAMYIKNHILWAKKSILKVIK